jgi:hypothetical protein
MELIDPTYDVCRWQVHLLCRGSMTDPKPEDLRPDLEAGQRPGS